MYRFYLKKMSPWDLLLPPPFPYLFLPSTYNCWMKLCAIYPFNGEERQLRFFFFLILYLHRSPLKKKNPHPCKLSDILWNYKSNRLKNSQSAGHTCIKTSQNNVAQLPPKNFCREKKLQCRKNRSLGPLISMKSYSKMSAPILY